MKKNKKGAALDSTLNVIEAQPLEAATAADLKKETPTDKEVAQLLQENNVENKKRRGKGEGGGAAVS